MCIEEGLHLEPDQPKTLLQEQIERRVFWSCYVIDRYSSNTLERPFAIAESDIYVGLPVEANDEEITAAEGLVPNLEAFRATYSPPVVNDMSVFLFCIRLRQISTRVPLMLSNKSIMEGQATSGTLDQFATGRLYVALDTLLQDLSNWRSSAPAIEQPRSLFEKSEWYNLLYARERLYIVRKALEVAPKRQAMPPRDIRVECINSAARTIEIFSDLLQRDIVTFTRSYFSTVYSAGLLIVFCVSVGTLSDRENIRDALEVLMACEDCLKRLGVNLPDSQHYAVAFGVLRGNLVKELSGDNNSIGEERAPVSSNRNDSSAEAQLPNGGTKDKSLYDGGLAGHEGTISNPTSASTDVGTINRNYFDPHWTQQPNYVHNDPRFPALYNIQDNEMSLYNSFLNDDLLWNMELGIGEYAYGDPTVGSAYFPAFDKS